MRIKCTKCKSILEVPVQSEKREIDCPVCKNRIMVDPEGGGAAAGGSGEEGTTPPLGGVPKKRRGFFSECFRRHKAGEVEEYFMVGTSKTTPDIFSVDLDMPRPWVFARLLATGVGIYLVLLLLLKMGIISCLKSTIPNFLIVGSFAVPLAVLLLFFELNVRRNVSLYQVLRMVFIGGILSMVLTAMMAGIFPWAIKTFNVPKPWQASLAGPIEESAKLIAVLMMIKGVKYRYVLNGMLFGAAVGAGFAVFESAGYAIEFLFQYFVRAIPPEVVAAINSGKIDANVSASLVRQASLLSFRGANIVIIHRGLFAPLGHVAYSAIVAGAMWRIRGGRKFSLPMLWDFRFVSLFLVAVALHALWNCDLPIFDGTDGMLLKCTIVGGLELLVLGYLVWLGIRQIRREQEEIVGDNR